MRSAFLHVLSDDSIVFQPGPQNGKKAWESKPASEEVLQWHPVLAATSTSGDLGYTTGPWTLKKSPANKEPTDFGHFVSIWRWENGKWKLLFDLGSDHPRPPAGPSRSCNWWKTTPSRIARHRSAVHAGPRSQLRLGPRPAFFLGRRGFDPSLSAAGISRNGREAAAAALARAPKPISFGEPKGEVSQRRRFGICLG
jgi:hypothetical protein